MYVCLCNRVTDRQLAEAAAGFAFASGTESVSSFAEEAADRLGAGLGCGSCRSFAVDLVGQAITERQPVVFSGRERDWSGLDHLPGGRRGDRALRLLPIGREEGALALPGAGGGRRA